ncbi:MAG: cupin domain-containing protein, partial [Bacillati bacterium ANGP1]
DAMAIHILDPLADGVPMPMISRQARLVISPHMGARYAVMNVVILAPGEKNDPHMHVASEDSLFLLSGSGWVHDLDAGERLPVEAGCAIVIPPGVRHTVEGGPQGVMSVGGPVPPDHAMLRALGVTT